MIKYENQCYRVDRLTRLVTLFPLFFYYGTLKDHISERKYPLTTYDREFCRLSCVKEHVCAAIRYLQLACASQLGLTGAQTASLLCRLLGSDWTLDCSKECGGRIPELRVQLELELQLDSGGYG